MEFVETEKTMKLMSDIMQGGTDSIQENSVQYDNEGKPKNDHVNAGKDGDEAGSDSHESFDDDH